MFFRPLGSSGIEASVIGLGAWAIGGWQWGGTDEKLSIKAIHAALDSGVNLVDTAPVYAFGYSEEIVGKAIKDRRNSVILATKCGLVWNVKKGLHHFNADSKQINPGSSEKQVYRYLAADSIRNEVEQSLKRMRVDHIDLLQTHWQDPTTPIAESMEELLKLQKEGKIRAIGVSNAATEDMDEYRKTGSLDVDQELYSMLDRSVEQTTLPYCEKNDIAFLAYSPLGKGILSGKIGQEYTFKDGDLRSTHPRFTLENRALVTKMIERLQPIADDMGVTMAQLCTSWTINQSGCSHALSGVRTPEQAVQNAAAGEIILNDEVLDIMARAIKQFEDKSAKAAAQVQ
jgi:methylglyoxal reductase